MPIAFDAFGTLFDFEALRQPARELAGELGDELVLGLEPDEVVDDLAGLATFA